MTTAQHPTISTDLTFETYFDDRLEEIMRILRAHLKAAEIEKIHRPIGRPGAKFPAIHLQPMRCVPRKETAGKVVIDMRVCIYLFEVGNDGEKIWSSLSKLQGMIFKMFSDNALGDLFSPTPTWKYAINPPYWVKSEIDDSIISEPHRFRNNEETLMMRCFTTIHLEDVIII